MTNEPSQAISSSVTHHFLERLGRLGLRDFCAAFLTSAPGGVVPEIKHCLAEVLHDVAAIEVDVLDHRTAILAIENDVLMLTGWAAAFDHNAERIGRADGCVRNIWRDEKGFAFPDGVVDDLFSLANPHFDVAFQLIEILF